MKAHVGTQDDVKVEQIAKSRAELGDEEEGKEKVIMKGV